MGDETDSIKINPCPRCGGCHCYSLRVVRSRISHYLPAFDRNTLREKSFVRLFVCPRDNEYFQATLSLKIEPGSMIKDVDVIGVEDDQDG